ncbi:DUF1552 domain-containing protein [Polyangium aurulentum]|uniref:DUF1552 domain-containing protein n=1 Tax=Polyangium aurulentum TaxID=2567896 RepID=UPI0010AE0430|nr:DUF1552 domain-containing protein [Polyangium aurulentum]UQA55524.1 DUF1552 domain-containing protein [Polyangium aurulentum]
MKTHKLGRRAVLRGLGGVAIGLPFLEAMGCSRESAPAAERIGRSGFGVEFPKRLLVFYTPNGTVPTNYWPTGDESNFTLSKILEPLEAHKQDLLILGGIDALSALSGPGDAHQKGTGSCLTGIENQEGDFPGDGGLSCGWNNGISLDQEIANAIGQKTKLLSLELGVLVYGSNVGSRISYKGPAQPLPPENDPYAVFDRIFGDLSADPGAEARKTAQRKAVLGKIKGDYQKLSAKLGADDQKKLDGHIAAIEDIATRLDNGGGVVLSGACQKPDLGAPIDVTKVVNLEAAGRLQMDLLTMAFACDATRVGTLMWTNSATAKVFGFLGADVTEGHHPLAHKGDDDLVARDHLTRINRFYAQQFAYLLEKLKSIPEGNGTLLDNTVVLWTNEQSKGNNHERHDMPYILAGGGGGVLKTGRYVKQAKNVAHNDLLLAILHTFGIEKATFGNPVFCKGPLAGLTA